MKNNDEMSIIKEKPENEEYSQISKSRFRTISQVTEQEKIDLNYHSGNHLKLKEFNQLKDDLYLKNIRKNVIQMATDLDKNKKILEIYNKTLKKDDILSLNHRKSNYYEYSNLENIIVDDFKELRLNYEDSKRSLENTKKILIESSSLKFINDATTKSKLNNEHINLRARNLDKSSIIKCIINTEMR
jgi:hypothetical protein